MKRVISAMILAIMMLSVAAPALAADCYYYDSYGTHAYEQISFSYPTCTKPGYVKLRCTVCGSTMQDETGDAYGHEWYKAAEKEATCTEKGVIYYCCDECYGEKTETTKALGHNYKVQQVIQKATCISGGKESVKCSRCGKTTTRETDKADHTYGQWSDVVAATDSAKGTRSRACTVCGKEQTEEYYPEGTLYRGIDDKEAVKVLQSQLTECGYLNDSIDGIFGKKTEQAVKDFQTKAGIGVDGIAWPQTNQLLEKEWLVATGAYVETCARIENENGVVEFAYCADHLVLVNAADALFEADDTEEEHINALLLVRQMYQEETDRLYAEWLAASADEDKPNVTAAQAMFVGYLNTQEMVWNKQYGVNSEEALTKVNEMLHDQWVELCGILDLISVQ